MRAVRFKLSANSRSSNWPKSVARPAAKLRRWCGSGRPRLCGFINAWRISGWERRGVPIGRSVAPSPGIPTCAVWRPAPVRHTLSRARDGPSSPNTMDYFPTARLVVAMAQAGSQRRCYPEFIQDDEFHPGQRFGEPALPSVACLYLEAIDEVDHIVERLRARAQFSL